MADYHTKTFFGQTSSIILTSPAKMVPYIFFRIINRKEDGKWEKTTDGEGKTVKISIEEIICILEVLNRKSANWRGYHVFHNRKTEIYVGWENETRQIIEIRLGDYRKKIRFPNLNLMTLLLEHILQEKIEFATSGTFETKDKDTTDQETDYSIFSEHITARDGLQVVETTEYGAAAEHIEIKAKIKVESPKALLITLDSGVEFWIPKSTIHSEYNVDDKNSLQEFTVDKWIIEKNKILK